MHVGTTASDYIDIPFNPYDRIIGTQAPTLQPKWNPEKNTNFDHLVQTTASYDYGDIVSNRTIKIV